MNKPRAAVTIAFLANGFVTGSFMARIPDYKHHFAISNASFGIALLCISLGVLVGLNPAGRWAARYGSSAVVTPSTIAIGIFAFAVSLAFNFYYFCAALFLIGITLATQDVAMNAHGIAIEHKDNKRYMSTFHAMFSIGGFAGAFVGGAFAQAKIHLAINGAFVALLTIFAALVLKGWLLPADIDRHEIEHTQRKKKPSIFWILGLLGFCAQVNEGIAGDWGGILARDTYNASPFLSAVPYVLFSTTMVIGRLFGDRISARFTTAKILSACGLISGLGLTTGLIAGGIIGEIFGWIALGAGLSVVVPVLFSESGRIARDKFPGRLSPSEGVAMVSGVAYSGFMAGPPVIGFLSSHFSLRGALFLPAVLAIILGVTAPRVLKNATS